MGSTQKQYGYVNNNPFAQDLKSQLKFQISGQIQLCTRVLSFPHGFAQAYGWEAVVFPIQTLETLITGFLKYKTTTTMTNLDDDTTTVSHKIRTTYKLKPMAELDNKYKSVIKKTFRDKNYSDMRFLAYLQEKFLILLQICLDKQIVAVKKTYREVI
ncbi:MAG: hypothetical protein WC346_21670 [Methanogenium sp.]|jgi:hypothetical protein